ncbi:TPA: hypothetical protein DEX28_01950 [Patescibacteria group bacterium]|nr:MAG: hypothetical protein UW85_C0001G0063 [Parcubacteria group bacterium GW2011_GWA1_Parcubacteria_45_10]KKT89274.1 MAG: hypothetical protein UW89_C0001G0002 [Parcubacteria group bacterium GW2011_GWB1_45_10]HCI05486.1 hypothetical protein [Patescibacteria group bacterium]
MTDKEKQLIDHLRRLKQVQPDFAYLKSFKRVLENRIVLDVKSEPIFFFRAFRLAASFGVFLLAFMGLGFGMVVATQNIPVDTFLYPVKLVGEKIQLGVQSFDAKSRADLKLKFALNRLSELKDLEENNLNDPSKIKALLDGYNQELSGIQNEVLRISVERDGETLGYLLEVESRLENISGELKVLRFDSVVPEVYLDAENFSSFMKELVSRKIFEYETKNRIFADDGQKWQRAMNEFLRLRSRGQMLAFSLNSSLSDGLKTTALELTESGEPLVTPQPENTSLTLDNLRSLNQELDSWQVSFNALSESGSDEDLLKLFDSLSEFEARLAEAETLLK